MFVNLGMEFKVIPNFENYEISCSGIVRTKARTITHKKPRSAKYYHVILYKDGNYKLFRIHQLVALVWVPNPFNYKVVSHKDGDKLNNNDWNLEWTTQAENIKHCKQVLGKNLNISLTRINQLYNENKSITIESFIDLIKQNCK